MEAVEGGHGRRTGLAGQLLTWETCPTSPGRQGLNSLPWAPTASPMPLASCLAPLPCAPGWAGSVPPSQLGGSALSPEPGSLFVPGAGPGWAPHCPHWPAAHRHHCFLARLLWLARWPPPSPAPPAAESRGSNLCSFRSLPSVPRGRGQADAASSNLTFCFLPWRGHSGQHRDLGVRMILAWSSVCAQ